MTFLISFAIRYWLQLTVVAFLLGLGTWFSVHERNVQYDKDQKVLVKVQGERDKAIKDRDGYKKSTDDLTAAVAAQKSAQAAQDARAATALAQAQKAAAAHAQSLQAQLSRYRASKPVTCATEALPEGVLQ